MRPRLQEYNYPLATTTWDEKEVDALEEVIASQNFTMGDKVKQFEKEFARMFSANYAKMSNSGSSANLLAMAAIRFSSFAYNPNRSEVIVPAVSWSTTYYPITQNGYTLKFVDVSLETLNALPSTILEAIGPKTAGIVAVNLLGNPSELTKIREIADSHNLFLVEDNCESMGATLDGKMAGTFGDIGTFSSFFSHHISTMEGGVSVTNSLELSEIMTSLRAHGWTRGIKEGWDFYKKKDNSFY